MAFTLVSANQVKNTVVRGVQSLPAIQRKAAIAVTTGLPVLAAHPALALVDDRLNGEGAGIPLGFNEPILAFVTFGMFGLIWALYASSAKSFGQQEEEDGLGL